MPTAWLDVPEWLRDRTFRGVPVVTFLSDRCRLAGFDDVRLLVDGPRPAEDAVFRLTEQGDAGQEGDTVDPWELAVAEKAHQERWVADLVRAGVRFADPWRVTIDVSVRIAPRATIGPDVVLRGATVIDAGAEVQAGVCLVDTTVAAGAVVKPYSVCERATIGRDAQVGPMAHLREGAVLESDVKVGNFVEVKKTTLRRGAKSSHLTYLGDADVGEDANIGAGTITCNYDGHRKHRTVIGARAFIGSNTALVAPVSVGDGAIIGAGSVITRDVPAGALAVERAPLRLLEGRAGAINERNRLAKASETSNKKGE